METPKACFLIVCMLSAADSLYSFFSISDMIDLAAQPVFTYHFHKVKTKSLGIKQAYFTASPYHGSHTRSLASGV